MKLLAEAVRMSRDGFSATDLDVLERIRAVQVDVASEVARLSTPNTPEPPAAALHELTADLEDILKQLNEKLEALYGRVEPVVLSWKGEAREVFVDKLDTWETARRRTWRRPRSGCTAPVRARTSAYPDRETAQWATQHVVTADEQVIHR